MSWLKIDDGFEDHAKVEPLSDAAHRLWMQAACWCSKPANARTNGFVPRAMLRTIAKNRVTQKRLDKLAQELVDARGGGTFEIGLWEPVDGGWRFHDWSQYQAAKPPEAASRAGRASAEARRQREGTAQPRRGARTTPERVPNGLPNGLPNGSRTELPNGLPNGPRTGPERVPNGPRTPVPDPDPDPDPEVVAKDLSGVPRARVSPESAATGTRNSGKVFENSEKVFENSAAASMRHAWLPSDGCRANLEMAGVPPWAELQLRARFIGHYLETDLVGTEAQWNQRFSRWALKDWQNPHTRPQLEVAKPAEEKTSREIAAEQAREMREAYRA